MNDLSKKKVGDKVFDALGGEWIVTEITDNEVCPVWVSNETTPYSVTTDGRYVPHMPLMLFSEPVRIVPAQGECDFSGYKVGDEVYLEDGSKMAILGRDTDTLRPRSCDWLDMGGKDLEGKQIAFHAPPNLVPSNPDAFKVPAHIAERKKAVDWSQVPIDTLVEVYVDDEWKTRYFAGWKSGTATYFTYGASSKTADELAWSTVQLSKIRLAEGGAE